MIISCRPWHPMKVLAAGALLFVALEPATIARADDASALDAAIADHFRRVPSEGVRYDGVTVYGETLSGARIRDEDRQAEIALYRRASKAAAMTNPSRLLMELCQNLLVHDPDSGVAFLADLFKAKPAEEEARNFLGVAAIVAAERGEALAVAALADPDVGWRRLWPRYLRAAAIYVSGDREGDRLRARLADQGRPSPRAGDDRRPGGAAGRRTPGR